MTRVQTWHCLNTGLQRTIVTGHVVELREGRATIRRTLPGENEPRADAPEEPIDCVEVHLSAGEPLLVEGKLEAVKVKLFGTPVAVESAERRVLHGPHGLVVPSRH
jgi:hypothetical protein